MAEPASIKFIQWDPLYERERPFQIFAELLPDAKDKRKHNISWEERDVEVEDLRGREHEVQIDQNGFEVAQLLGFPNLVDHDVVEDQYLPAVRSLLHSQLKDVGTVFILDWRIRSSRPGSEGGIKDGKIMYSDCTVPLLPSNYAHVDMSALGVIQRIQREFPNQWQKMLRQRIRAVNVWKPLANPVTEWALAVVDGATVDEKDLIETDSLRQGFRNTFYYVRHNEGQRWCYLKNQTPEEALVFKHFDSDPTVPVPTTAHASMRHARVPEDGLPRRSIEVRTLVFSDVFDV